MNNLKVTLIIMVLTKIFQSLISHALYHLKNKILKLQNEKKFKTPFVKIANFPIKNL